MSDYEVPEGSVVPVEIAVLSGMLEREVVVMVSTSDDTAQGKTSYHHTELHATICGSHR